MGFKIVTYPDDIYDICDENLEKVYCRLNICSDVIDADTLLIILHKILEYHHKKKNKEDDETTGK